MKKLLIGLTLISTPAFAQLTIFESPTNDYQSQIYYTAGVEAISHQNAQFSLGTAAEIGIEEGNVEVEWNLENGITDVEAEFSNSVQHNEDVVFGCNIVNPEAAFVSMKDYWKMHAGLDEGDISISDIEQVIIDRREVSNGHDMNAAVACWAESLLDDWNYEDIATAVENQFNYTDDNIQSGNIETLALIYLTLEVIAVPYTFTDIAYSEGIDLTEFYSSWTQLNATSDGRQYLADLVTHWNMLMQEDRVSNVWDFEADVTDYGHIYSL